VSLQGLMSHLARNRYFRRQVFPGNQLLWYWPVFFVNDDKNDGENDERILNDRLTRLKLKRISRQETRTK